MASDLITTSLVRRVEARDDEAWSRLVRIYSLPLERFLARCGVTESDRQDLQNEVFSQAFQSLSAFQGQHGSKSFLAWLRTIAKRCVARWWQQAERKRDRAVGGSDFLTLLHSLPEQPSADEHAELLSEFVRMLDLSDFQRRLLNLYLIENRTADDVGQQLGMTGVAVRQAAARLLRSIREEHEGLESW